MEYIRFAIALLVGLFIYTIFMRIFMGIANRMGETLGIGRLVIYIYRKIVGGIKKVLNYSAF